MHEWALAEAVVASASEIAEKKGLKEITHVRIELGELQQIEPEILEFAFSQLRKDRLQNATFTIKTIEAAFQCRICGNRWDFKKERLGEDTREAIHFLPELAHTYVKCPGCGSPDFEILQGRGIWLESIEGV